MFKFHSYHSTDECCWIKLINIKRLIFGEANKNIYISRAHIDSINITLIHLFTIYYARGIDKQSNSSIFCTHLIVFDELVSFVWLLVCLMKTPCSLLFLCEVIVWKCICIGMVNPLNVNVFIEIATKFIWSISNIAFWYCKIELFQLLQSSFVSIQRQTKWACKIRMCWWGVRMYCTETDTDTQARIQVQMESEQFEKEAQNYTQSDWHHATTVYSMIQCA